jgi:hypothetical protein
MKLQRAGSWSTIPSSGLGAEALEAGAHMYFVSGAVGGETRVAAGLARVRDRRSCRDVDGGFIQIKHGARDGTAYCDRGHKPGGPHAQSN